jgi:hypothetical protein
MKHKINFKVVAPIAAILLAFCVSLIILPVVKGEAKEIPVAIVSLDQGVTTPAGEVNLGDKVLQTIQSKFKAAMADQTTAAVKLHVVKTEDQLNRGFDDKEYYGAIVVPKNFTQKQLAGKSVSLKLILDQGQSVTIASSLSEMIGGMATQAQISIKTEYINKIGDDMADGNANLFAFVMTWIATFASSILLYVGFNKPGIDEFNMSGKLHGKLLQMILAAVTAGVLALTVAFILKVEFSFGIPFTTTFVFLTVAIFSLMMLIVGILNWTKLVGGVLLVLMMLMGLLASNLPYEILPTFWQNYIYPWIPMRFLGDGLKEIFYLGGDAWNPSTQILAWIGFGGIVLSLLSVYKKQKVEN